MISNKEVSKDVTNPNTGVFRLTIPIDNPLVLGMLEVLAGQRQKDARDAVQDLQSIVHGIMLDYRPDEPLRISVNRP